MGSTRKPVPRLGKNVLFGLGCAALSWVVLLFALQAGLRLSLEEYLSPLARTASLDYLLGEGGIFGALREGYVADVLGLDPRSPVSGEEAGEATFSPPASPPVIAGEAPPERGRPARTFVEEPLDNDEFGKAYPVASVPFTAKTDTSEAGREPGEPEGCDLLGVPGGTVWFRFQPDGDMGLLAGTFGTSYSAALTVFSGSSLSDLEEIGCDLDPAGNAQVTFPARTGTTYYFQVTAPAGGGQLVFSLDPLGTTEVVSLSDAGEGGSGGHASVSADGRYVAFESYSNGLVEGDTNDCHASRDECPDVFVRDRVTGRTVRVSVDSSGRQVSEDPLDGGSWIPSISADGRYVAFASGAPDLVPGDRNGVVDVFVHDRDHDEDGRFDELHPGALETERVSVSSTGAEGRASDSWREACVATLAGGCWFNQNAQNMSVSISDDGRYVVFSSDLDGLVEGVPRCTDTGGTDTDGGADHVPSITVHDHDAGVSSCRQIYVRDRLRDETFLASASSTGAPANADSSSGFISRNGRWVVFASGATNLAPVVEADSDENPDSNGARDVFIRNMRTGGIELVSLSSTEEQGDRQSGGVSVRGHATVSNNGRWVTFISQASNLAREDNDLVLYDVFLRDRRQGRTILVSKGSDEDVSHCYITADGRYIATKSNSSDPVGSERTALQMTIVWDRVTRTETIVSVTNSGEPNNGELSGEPEITGDGRFVVFVSDATNLDERDPETDLSVYIHELPWIR